MDEDSCCRLFDVKWPLVAGRAEILSDLCSGRLRELVERDGLLAVVGLFGTVYLPASGFS